MKSTLASTVIFIKIKIANLYLLPNNVHLNLATSVEEYVQIPTSLLYE